MMGLFRYIFLALSPFIFIGCTVSGNILSELGIVQRLAVDFISGSTASSVNSGNQASVPISGYCPEEATQVIVGAPISQTLACSSGQFSGNMDFSAIVDGNYNIPVTPDSGTAATWSIVKDTVLPTLSGVSIPSYINISNSSSFPAVGSCSENGQLVNIQVGAFLQNVTCSAGAFSASLNLSAIGEGAQIVSISTVDSAGNTSVVSNFPTTKDTLVPAVAIISNLPGSPSPIVDLDVVISGSEITHYRYVVGPSGSTDCNNTGLYSAEVSQSTHITQNISALPDGSIKLCVWPRDIAGNYLPVTSASLATWIKDSTIALAVLGPYIPAGSPSNSTVDRTITVSGVDIVSYKYVLLKDAFCSTADFSSAIETVVATPITLPIASGDGTYRACVIGKNSTGIWQPSASPTSSADLMIDTVSPTFSITSANLDPTNSNIDVTVTFSEQITGFAVGDLVPINSTISGFFGGPSIYTFTLIPSGQGIVSVSLGASAVQDLASNQNGSSGSLSRTFDSIQPAVTITSVAPSQTNVSPIPVMVTFSEPVTGFISADVTLSNGIITGFTGGPTVYNLQITPILEGTVSVDIAAGIAQDSSGNLNTIAAATLNRVYDITLPTVTLSSVAPDPTTGSFAVTATFSESVIGFDSSDISLTNATVSGFGGGPTVYTFTVNPSAQGLVDVAVGVSQCQDGAGNLNLASATLTRTYDSLAPTIILSTAASNPTNSGFSVTATFSEAVTGFVLSDVGITNGALSNFTGGPTVYTFDITPTTDGLVTISVPSNVAQDGAGLNNSVALDLTRTYDSTMPTVTLTTAAPDPTTAGFSVTATFSESVMGFDASDIVAPRFLVSNFSGGPSVFTFDVTPIEDGINTITVPATVCTDLGGSPNAAGSLTRTVDASPPQIAVASPTLPITEISPIPFSIIFSEEVIGFDQSDISVTNGTISNFNFIDGTYHFDITPSGVGDVVVSVLAGAAVDVVGNPTAAGSLTRTYDPVPLTGVLSSVTPNPFNSGNMVVAVTFNKSVTLTAADFSILNGTISNISGAGAAYTVDVTPSGQGTVQLDLIKVMDRPTIARVFDSVPPTAPSGLSIDDSNMTLFHTPRISWGLDADDGALGTGIAEYQVQIYDQWGDPFENAIGSFENGSRIDVYMRRQASYSARIRARDYASNWSAWSMASPVWIVNRNIIEGGAADGFCFIQSNGQVKCWARNDVGQLGLGDTMNRGISAGQMAALPDVNVGTGRTIKKIFPSNTFNCALLDNDQIKCWGYNQYGELGLGLPLGTRIGDGPAEMGDNLAYVNLGVGRSAKDMWIGKWHACAILDNDQIKCWGKGLEGALGNESNVDYNVPTTMMGLGTGLTIKKITAGANFNCALFTSGSVKCWGESLFGARGSGDTGLYGNMPGQMGDGLPFLNLGTGRTAKDIFSRFAGTCALLDNNESKCWGRNGWGQLGVGDINHRGDNPGEMGDSLPAIPWGSGLFPIRAPGVSGEVNCALLGNRKVKCIGQGGWLGLGDAIQRYTLAQLGDNLPFLDFGFGRTVVDLATSSGSQCATLDNKSIICWGRSNFGQMGQGDTNTIGDNEAITTFIAPSWFYNLQMILSSSADYVSTNGSITFFGSGGYVPYSYSIIAGGGSINSSTGVYTAPGTAGSVTVQAVDSRGNSATSTITIKDCVPGSMAFNYTGGSQVFTMPNGCTKATIKAWGGGGAGGSQWTSYGNTGGGGGYATGVINLAPSETLTVYVGGAGVFTGSGGWNGGASAGPRTTYPQGGHIPGAGGGGGASDVRRVGTLLTDRILVAGGGGGAGSCYTMYNNACVGGAGGGVSGTSGTMYNGTITIKMFGISGTMTITGAGGAGGTSSAGGAGGVCTSCVGNSGSSGSLANGGAPYGAVTYVPGGGGGGGYYGGGGGAAWSGGGGGSSYVGGMSSGSVISGSGASPGNFGDVDRAGAGQGGGNSSNGVSGRVVIYYE